MEIIVPADSPIKTPADIKGKKLAFTAPTSNSGFKAPSALLSSEFNLEAKKDYEPVFSGKHDNSVIGVANKDYDAAAIANEVMFRMFERKVVDQGQDPDDLQIGNVPDDRLWHGVTISIPRCRRRSRKPFSPSLGKVRRCKPNSRANNKFVPITYKKDWNVIRKIDAASGVKYSLQVRCRSLGGQQCCASAV